MLKFITMLTLFLFGMVAKGQVSEGRKVPEFNKVEQKKTALIYTENNQKTLKVAAEIGPRVPKQKKLNKTSQIIQ